MSYVPRSFERYVYDQLKAFVYRDEHRDPAKARHKGVDLARRKATQAAWRARRGKETNSYVLRMLGMRNAPRELIEAKRELLKLKREIVCVTVKS